MASPVKSEAQRLLDKLYKIKQESLQKAPQDFHNARYWSGQWGKSISRTRDYLKMAVEKGLMERRYYMTGKDGIVRKTAFYKLIK
jgi:hypothetical protein